MPLKIGKPQLAAPKKLTIKREPKKEAPTKSTGRTSGKITGDKNVHIMPDPLIDYPLGPEGSPKAVLPVEHGRGASMMKAKEPTYIVELDAGAFIVLWQMLEGESKAAWARYHGWIPEYADAMVRACEAFRISGKKFTPESKSEPTRRWQNRSISKAKSTVKKARQVRGKTSKLSIKKKAATKKATVKKSTKRITLRGK